MKSRAQTSRSEPPAARRPPHAAWTRLPLRNKFKTQNTLLAHRTASNKPTLTSGKEEKKKKKKRKVAHVFISDRDASVFFFF